jgi:hypothetical protein
LIIFDREETGNRDVRAEHAWQFYMPRNPESRVRF